MVDHMLSTSDNPFNPFTQYEEWNAWDTLHGYHTLGLVARVVVFPMEASESDQSLAIEYGLQDIMAELGEIETPEGKPLYILVPEPEVIPQPAA
jgi:hypothetical protein